jgi:hypothetical protein
MPVKIREIKEDLDITVAGRLWPLCYNRDSVWLYLNPF